MRTIARILWLVLYFGLPGLVLWLLFVLSPEAASYPPVMIAGIGSGIVAYLIFCMQFVIVARPRFLERAFGLDAMFRFHAVMAMAAMILALAHKLLISTASRGDGEHWSSLPGGTALAAYLALGLFSLIFLTRTALGRIPGLASVRSLGLRFGLSYGLVKLYHNAALVITALVCLHVLTAPVVGALPLLQGMLAIPFATAFGFWLFHKVFRGRERFNIIAMEKVAPRVVRIRLSPESGTLRPYRAGQFLFVRFDIPGLAFEDHPFTISNPPGDSFLEITVKAAGDWTLALFDLAGRFPGSATRQSWKALLDYPFGRFFVDPANGYGPGAGPQLFLAGGIGITPFLAMAGEALHDHYLAPGSNPRILILWSARTRDELAGFEVLAKLNARLPSIRMIPLLARDPLWTGYRGHLDESALRSLAREELEDPKAGFWICGPAAMRSSLLKDLKALGVKRRRIRFENFAL